MSRFWHNNWYHLVLLTMILAPFALVHSSIVDEEIWEDSAERVYAELMKFDEFPSELPASQITIVEVDDESIAEYSWPIPRQYYIEALQKLSRLGKPWVVSMLRFQDSSEEVKSGGADSDEQLANAILAYEKFIGTGLIIEDGEELTEEQEDTLMPKALVAKPGMYPETLPFLPLKLGEADRFVEAQRAFGVSTRFGSEAVVNCMPMHFPIGQDMVIPTGFALAAGHLTGRSLQFSNGVTKSFGDQRQSAFAVSERHCLRYTKLSTREYLQKRDIDTISFKDLLEGEESRVLNNRIVIFGNSASKKFQLAGPDSFLNESIATEYQAAARFLDGLLIGKTVGRLPLSASSMPLYASLGLLAVFLLSAFFLPLGNVILVAGCALIFFFVGAFQSFILQDEFFVPIKIIVATAAVGVSASIYYIYLKFVALRRSMEILGAYKNGLMQTQSIAQLQEKTKSLGKQYFSTFESSFRDYDEHLFAAAENPEKAYQLLKERESQDSARGVHSAPDESFTIAGNSIVSQTIATGEQGHLGSLRLELTFRHWERTGAPFLVEGIQREIGVHWDRIRVIAEQKLADYKVMIEQTRGDILKRFLTQMIVSKFADDKSMEENLGQVLTPRANNVALFQADLRGYSKISANLKPMDMVEILQKYYRNVVDAAQVVAQVKLIGDCIFLFIEETEDKSAMDHALDLALILVDETMKQNANRPDSLPEPLKFGIALHYGEAVVGNLSSDHCIDYTVIGPNVNLVARLEELTKKQEIQDLVGFNGILLSCEAAAALNKHTGAKTHTMSLVDMGLQVRSFEQIERVSYIRADDAISMRPERLFSAS